jgi:CubicO group peptidase (beta-lactamase class C family)
MAPDTPDGRRPPAGRRGPTRRIRTRLTALAAAGAIAALLSGCSAPPGATPAPPIPAPGGANLIGTDVDAWLDGLVPAALERSGIAGAAVTVVHDGRVLTTRGYGYADTGSDGDGPRPVDPDETLFRVGSIAKVFVATAVLQQVEQGQIDLDTDVQRYLDFPLPRTFEPPITMRHLLTHTAGFEERVRGVVALGGPAVGLRETVAVDPPEQVFEPGTVPSYSNFGYALAGYVVERVSGVPFDSYVERNVLDRIGMASSSFAQPLPPDLAGRLSEGYDTDSDPAGPFEVIGPAPAGALSASATDMGRFMLAQLGELGPDQALLAPDTLALMKQPALDAASLGALAAGPRMALGLFDESRNGHRIVGHGGDTRYFHSHMQLYPDDRVGVFVTLNSSGRGATDSHELRQSLLEGFADRYFPAGGAAERPAAPTGASHAAMAEGSYESARLPFSNFLTALGLLGQTRVTARPDGTVLLVPGPMSMYPAVYREVEPWVWQEVGGHGRRPRRGARLRVGVHAPAHRAHPRCPRRPAGAPGLDGRPDPRSARLAGRRARPPPLPRPGAPATEPRGTRPDPDRRGRRRARLRRVDGRRPDDHRRPRRAGTAHPRRAGRPVGGAPRSSPGGRPPGRLRPAPRGPVQDPR